MTPRRLRIALAIEDIGPGGGQERVIAELVPRLARNHDLHLFCFKVRDVPIDGMTLHRLRDPHLPLGMRALWFTLASSLAIRPRDFDVVLSQGGNCLVQNAMLAHTGHRERRRIRRELQQRGRGRSIVRRAWEALRDRAFIRLEARAVRRCRGRIMTVSRSLRDYLLREYDLRPEEVHVTRNGVDHAVFHRGLREETRARIRKSLGLSEDEFVAIFMGGRWHEKRLAEVVEALGLTREPVRLAVVGVGERAPFEALAAEAGVRQRVLFVAHVDRPQEYLAMADCLVAPNREEPFGLVTLEAAACGLPLIAARTGAALDLIEDGVSGFFVEPEPAQIAARLDELARDRARAASMGEAAWERAQAFSWDRQAEEIEALLLRFTAEEADRA